MGQDGKFQNGKANANSQYHDTEFKLSLLVLVTSMEVGRTNTHL
jgi:hypothetical protein